MAIIITSIIYNNNGNNNDNNDNNNDNVDTISKTSKIKESEKIKDTEFGKWDSILYSPLCLFIGICGVLIQIIK